MKKLSELADDTILCTEYFSMSKNEYLNDYCCEENLVHSLSVADKEILKFDLKDIIYQICEDGFEDMGERVYDDIKDLPETKTFLKVVKKVFENNPVYWMGEDVIDDVTEEEE